MVCLRVIHFAMSLLISVYFFSASAHVFSSFIFSTSVGYVACSLAGGRSGTAIIDDGTCVGESACFEAGKWE